MSVNATPFTIIKQINTKIKRKIWEIKILFTVK